MDDVVLQVRRLGSSWGRFVGLIGGGMPEPGCAVWLDPCRQVHTLFMGYPIDVVHLDSAGTVLEVATLAPWRLGRWVWGARSVLELRAGEADRLGIRPGSKPRLIEDGGGATKFVEKERP